jgi:hypothetical protein
MAVRLSLPKCEGVDWIQLAQNRVPALDPMDPVGIGNLSPGQSGRCVKLSTHLHLVPRLRMREIIPPLPHTFSWSGA